jgi:hypothetical protein
VSLNKPNKRFALSQKERLLRILEFLKNVWRVRQYFLKKFNKEPLFINGDQMPLHRNENSDKKTLTMTAQDTYVKENYMASRERVTVYTQLESDGGKPVPEIVFKGKGTRTQLEKPEGMQVQWAPKGSYRLETMIGTVSHLKNRKNLFTHQNYAVYILDDYSVHITPEVRDAMLQRGYILICIGGGVTGDIQVNDTHVHHQLKKHYRQYEAQLMIDQLTANPGKIPNPSKNEMMDMVAKSWQDMEWKWTASWPTRIIS